MVEWVEKVAMPSRLRQRVDRLRPRAAMAAQGPGRPEPVVLAEQERRQPVSHRVVWLEGPVVMAVIQWRLPLALVEPVEPEAPVVMVGK